jgi:branched-chain amino acid aminotransferase
VKNTGIRSLFLPLRIALYFIKTCKQTVFSKDGYSFITGEKMEIATRLLPDSQRKPLPDENALGFGINFTDHMFVMDYAADKGWHDPQIVPYAPFQMDPAAACFHYAQAIFEGLKAYRDTQGRIRMFRAVANARRFNASAKRMCMPQIEEEFICRAIEETVRAEERWVPRKRGTSLYVRPFMIATEPFLGVRPATQYRFSIILSPVGAYYAEGFNPVRIFVTDKYVRAVKGGVGEAKTAGNYAASLMASEEAKKAGFTQVLWLDGVERRNVEEVGTMNIFFVLNDTLVTPALSGSILPGITRDSVITLAKSWGMPVEERVISIDEVIEDTKTGRLKECFGTGTAAVISPVKSLYYKEKEYAIGSGEAGPVALRLFDELTGIQYGERPDPFGWVKVL